MPELGGGAINWWGLFAVLVLVIANGFFVAAEFSLVALRRSRVSELVSDGRMNAKALERAVDNLDANLAATQLGITMSSLALGWIGEPALAHIVQPMLGALPETLAVASAHSIAVGISFVIITALHIVLGELAPKSLALQRSEQTALWIVRPLALFLFLLRPAIYGLNSVGNMVLRLFGLKPGTGEESLHSASELKLLIKESQQAGILQLAQREVVVRALNIGERRIGDIMSPRTDVEWVDADDTREEIMRIILESSHEQLLVGRGSIDQPLGTIVKSDILEQALAGQSIDPLKVMRQPYFVHDHLPIFKVLEQFKRNPIRIAMIVNEYGTLEGIVTQTDLLEAFAGDLPGDISEPPAIVEKPDGTFTFEGTVPIYDAFERLGIRNWPEDGGFHTIAGFALAQMGRIPSEGESFSYEGWRFEVKSMDGMRIQTLLVRKQ